MYIITGLKLVGAVMALTLSTPSAQAGVICNDYETLKTTQERDACWKAHAEAVKKLLANVTQENADAVTAFYNSEPPIGGYRSMGEIQGDLAVDRAMNDYRRAVGRYEGSEYLSRSRGY